MKTGLSKREKVLVFIAASALLIYVSVQFGIGPLYRSYSERTAQYGILSVEKTMLELKLQSEALTRDNHAEAGARFQEIGQRYPAVMPNEEIDRILTGLCLQNSLSPSALRISDAVDFFAAEEQNTQDEQAAQDEQAEAKKPAAFVTVEASMLLSGDYRSLKRLIDAVEEIDYIRLGSVSYLYDQGDSAANPSNISAVFEITMRKDAPEAEGVA